MRTDHMYLPAHLSKKVGGCLDVVQAVWHLIAAVLSQCQLEAIDVLNGTTGG